MPYRNNRSLHGSVRWTPGVAPMPHRGEQGKVTKSGQRGRGRPEPGPDKQRLRPARRGPQEESAEVLAAQTLPEEYEDQGA